MKTKFNSNLFKKKLNLADANFVFGSTGGCTHTTYHGEVNGCEACTTTYYDDNGTVIKRVHQVDDC